MLYIDYKKCYISTIHRNILLLCENNEPPINIPNGNRYFKFKTNAFFINAAVKSTTKRTKKSISTDEHFQSDMT